MRTCRQCGLTFSTECFYPRQARCKSCVCAKVRAHRAANVERIRECDRRRAQEPAKRASISAISKRWRETHPQWRKAQHIVGNAIRDGILVRPTRCSRRRQESRVEAHHHDYSKPLVVEWVCKPCHARADAERRSEVA